MQVANFGRVVLWVVAAVLLFMAAFFGLNRLRDDSVVMQSYAVPPEIGEEVTNALAGALWRGESTPPIGQVRRLPNGRVLVTAPASVQNSVGRVIDDIIKNKPGPTPTIAFDMWVVVASPGEASPISGALADIAPALGAILKATGPAKVELLEKVSTAARAGGRPSQVHGARANMQVQASLRSAEDGQQLVAAELRLGVTGFGWNSSLEAQSEMHPGELLVAGQSALGSEPGTPPTNKQIYYILRATL
jgi:hypothetical protein